MIKELILYFLMIFGFFSLIEDIFKAFAEKKYIRNTYIITSYNSHEDREKVIYLAKTVPVKIYVLSPLFTDTADEEYITDRYFNVEFIKNTSEIITED